MSKRIPQLLVIISTVFIILFTYTAVSKLIDLNGFRYAMLNQPLPNEMNQLLVWAIPAMELVTVILLLINNMRIYGLYLSGGLLLLFTAYVGLVILNVFGRVPCSCGGILESLSWEEHFGVNVIFLALALVGIWGEENRTSDIEHRAERKEGWPEAME